MQEKQKERIECLDIIRSIAIMMVVMCHVSEKIYFYSGVDIIEQNIISEIVGFTLFSLGRLGVPLFLFISGYLLLTREYDDTTCRRFWGSNLLSLFFVTEIWIVLLNLFNVIVLHKEFRWSTLIRNMLFLKPTDMSHMWYLPMILGMYLTIPLVAVVVQKMCLKTLFFPYIVIVMYTFGIPTLNLVEELLGREKVFNQLALNFGGGMCGAYLIMGYFFKKGILNSVKTMYLWGGMSSCFIATVIIQMFLFHQGIRYQVWYDFILLFMTSIFLFELLKRKKYCKNIVKYGRVLAKYSFGIYLVHNLVLIILNKLILVGEMNTIARVLGLWGATLGISFLSVKILSAIPGIGKKMFLLKE